jgi:hypothetical protein
MVAIVLALFAIFGWDWGQSYRTRAVDTWELPILSTLLIVAAVIPVQMRVRPFMIALVTLGVFSLLWWIVERGELAYGGYDIGGIALRVLSYGTAFLLLLTKQRDPSTGQAAS